MSSPKDTVTVMVAKRAKKPKNRDTQARKTRAKARVLIPQDALDLLEQVREERARRFPEPEVDVVYRDQRVHAYSK